MRYPALILFLLCCLPQFTKAAVLPPGFAEIVRAQQLNPTDMCLAPDGRIFITQKDGRVLIYHSDEGLHADPFYTIKVDNYNERGLSGIALHPDFANQPWVYLYYTVPGENHNRVVRVQAGEHSAIPGTESTLLDLDPLNATIHNGGAMVFGPDGKLYITAGDGGNAQGAQSLQSTAGKVLRLNDDGSIPSDNPFYNQTNDKYRAIYALGFRNPFSMSMDAGSGRIFLSDVGNASWEEVNEVKSGKNYGWPIVEGPLAGQTPPDNYEEPKHAYSHAEGCSVLGAAFSRSDFPNYPPQFSGKFFFSDYCKGYIKAIDPNTGQETGTFITGINRPLKFFFAPNGDFFYLARAGLGGGSDVDNTSTDNGALVQVFYIGTGEPFFTGDPKPVLASVSETPTFQVQIYGNQPMHFRWQKDGLDVPNSDSSVLVLPPVNLADDGAYFRCIAENGLGADTSAAARLTVTSNQRPQPIIDLPDQNALWHGGDTIFFSGRALDQEEGLLGAEKLVWRVNFHHDMHTHPVLGPQNNLSNGNWIVPENYETDPDVWFRIYLTATDTGGLSKTIYREIFPEKHQLSIDGPAGQAINLDGSTLPLPLSMLAVAGINRNAVVPASFIHGDSIYTFVRWSDGNTSLSRNFKMPASDLKLALVYQAVALSFGTGLLGSYYDDDDFDFSGTPVLTRIDPTVNFDWGPGAPAPVLPADNYAIRWEGFLLPLYNEELTLHTISDDGVRLWVDDNLLIDKWIPQSATEWTASAYLDAGKKHKIRLEFFELGGDAVVKLYWSSNRIPKSPIPQQQLFPPLPYQAAIVQGKAWKDLNYNGLEDAGETPLENVTVLLQDSSGNLVNARQTAANGSYQFSVPPPGGKYHLRFVLPAAIADYENTSGLNAGGFSNLYTFQPGGFIGLKAGFAPKRAAIQGLIWLDENNNGFPDFNEPGLEGLTLQLFKSDSSLVRNIPSGAQGLFLFDKLSENQYFVQVVNNDTTLVPGLGLLTNTRTPLFQLLAGSQKYLQLALKPKLLSAVSGSNVNDEGWYLYPNPCQRILQVVLPENQSDSGIFEVVNASGARVAQYTQGLQKGMNQFHLDLKDLPSGWYHLVWKNAQTMSIRRFLRE